MSWTYLLTNEIHFYVDGATKWAPKIIFTCSCLSVIKCAPPSTVFHLCIYKNKRIILDVYVIYIYINEHIRIYMLPIYMLQDHKLCPMWVPGGPAFKGSRKALNMKSWNLILLPFYCTTHVFFEQKLNIPLQTKIVNSFPVCYQFYLIWSQQRTHHPIETCWRTCTIRDQPTWLAGESPCSIRSYISSNSRKATSSICSLSVLVSWCIKIGSFFVLSWLDVATLVVFGSWNFSLSPPHPPPKKTTTKH